MGVSFGVLVACVFLVLSIYACCTKDEQDGDPQLPENTDDWVSNADLASVISRPSELAI